jgi:hypothetical protein
MKKVGMIDAMVATELAFVAIRFAGIMVAVYGLSKSKRRNWFFGLSRKSAISCY